MQVPNLKSIIDIGNEKAILTFFDEYLADYNDNAAAVDIIKALTKLLSDSVYNNPRETICMTQISKRIVKDLSARDTNVDYYTDFWENPESVLNRPYTQRHEYDSEILKIAFSREHRNMAKKLFDEIDKLNNTRAGYYLRHIGDMTLLVSIKKNSNNKENTAFRMMKTAVHVMNVQTVLSIIKILSNVWEDTENTTFGI